MFATKMKKYLGQHLLLYFIWSIFSIISGLFVFLSSHLIFHYFFMMTLSWGVINLVIAALLYLHIRGHHYLEDSMVKQIKIQHHIEKYLYLNIGLDVGYIGIGSLMLVFSFTTSTLHKLWLGFGTAILAQGIIMLLLDVCFHVLHFYNYRQYLKQNTNGKP